jgi:hypothetical protein
MPVFTEQELRLIHIALGIALQQGWDTGVLQVKVGDIIQAISDSRAASDPLS